MEVPNLCLNLISSAFHRCRVHEDLCRLSVVLRSSQTSDPLSVRISISDTGIGSCLEEFQNLKHSVKGIGAEIWDGMLTVKTTSVSDDEAFHYRLNLSESVSTRRLTRLPSNPKNGAKFSGTEVCLSISASIDTLVAEIKRFLQKLLILKIPHVAIELVVVCEDVPGSRCESVFLANESNPLPFPAPNVERLKSGLEDYVVRHENNVHQKCDSCFPTLAHLKVGSGTVCSKESKRNSGQILEVVVIISELESTSPCSRTCCSKTEVLFFKDFEPCLVSQQTMNALTNINWRSYGLTLKKVVSQGEHFLDWENLPPHTCIDMVLHCYHKQFMVPSVRGKTQPDRCLIKRATELAFNNLKEKYPGALLGEHASKLRIYAPDLARSIAGLILSSDDPEFQGQCISFLGLQSGEIEAETVEGCIKEKIISVIETNDRKCRGSKEVVAPFLFEEHFLDTNFEDNSYESEYEGEDAFSFLD